MTAGVDTAGDVVGAERSTGGGSLALAYVLTVVVAALWVLGGILLSLNRHVIYGNQWFLWGLFTVTGVAYVIAALAIVRRHPGNAIWWLFFVIAGSLALGTVMPEYGIYAIKSSPGTLPVPALILALAEPTPIVALAGIVLVLQLFPDGHPVSRAWRAVLWVTVVALLLGVATQLLSPHRIVDVWSDDLDHARVSALDPLGVSALSDVGHVVNTVAALVLTVTSLFSVVSLFVRRRKADPVQHTQLRWLAWVVAVTALWIVVMVPLMIVFGQNSLAAGLFWIVATPLVALGIPISIGIAIVRVPALRHRCRHHQDHRLRRAGRVHRRRLRGSGRRHRPVAGRCRPRRCP